MITAKDLNNYFDQEFEIAREGYAQLMRLPLKQRIRKRKAVDGLKIDFDKDPWWEDNDLYFIVRFSKNLADFKEGDILCLHTEDDPNGIDCTLTGFDGENGIILSISSFNSIGQSLVLQWRDCKLVLDKTLVDLRRNVYDKFLQELPFDNAWWTQLLVNNRKKPSFVHLKECEEELLETEKEFGISLNQKQREAILCCMESDDYYLVQGPPGTGKSFILGIIILEELLYFKRRVVVIGPNHLAINNVLEQILKIIPQYSDLIFKIGQFYNAPLRKVICDGEEKSVRNVTRMSYMGSDVFRHSFIVGMTPHALFTSRARDLVFDTLIIDEAGQMSIPLAMMGMVKADKVILAGDHKQLPPIINAEQIKSDLKNSIFQLLADENNCTMLNQTYRMNEAICAFVSDLFYDGQVVSCAKSKIHNIVMDNDLLDFNNPVVMLDVDDNGEQTSDKEADAIAEIVEEYVIKGVNPEDIGILSPFRAQASNIRKFLRKKMPETMRENPVAVETIDKMQGQEKDIIVLSFVAGKLDYMEEMGDFLYNPQKLNVAFSRAKSKLILTGNVKALKQLNGEKFQNIHRILNSRHIKIFRK